MRYIELMRTTGSDRREDRSVRFNATQRHTNSGFGIEWYWVVVDTACILATEHAARLNG